VLAQYDATLHVALPADDARAVALSHELKDLQAGLAREGATAHLRAQAEALCERARRLLAHRHHLVDELHRLTLEMSAGLAEVAEEGSWVKGQTESLKQSLGESPSVGQLAGVLLISAGLAWLVLWGQRTNPSRPAALGAAVATGLMIAAYTTVDGIGVRLAHSTLGYIAWLMLLEQIVIPAGAFATHGRTLWRRIRPVWPIGVAGGAMSVAAYGLVLWAQTRGALAEVAALRESSIIAGALIGTLLFKESFGTARIFATCAVAAGIATMYLL